MRKNVLESGVNFETRFQPTMSKLTSINFHN